VSDGQKLPTKWDVAKGTNIAWKTAIPGLAHSSPITWGDRIFVTTAVSSRPDAGFRRGLYGDGDASDDRSVQKWKVLCLNARTGTLMWDRLAYEGTPREKRHVKSTYASSTPATDGEVVVAFFGSQGLYAYDLEGRPLWTRDLGRIDAGAYDLPDYEWGTASSPILYRDLVIVQCDQQKGSFVAALDRKTGKTVWKTERDELPSWGTPTIYPGKTRTELVTNSPNFIRGYDPLTGKELWRLGRSSKITAPTPIFAGDLILVASGRRPEAPIFAIRAGSSGDITLVEEQTQSRAVAWSKTQRGPYMPTPLFYRGTLYVLGNAGIFDAYDFQTGREIYRQRIPHQGSGFSASPVASDGKIYLSSEDGDIFLVSAGENFALVGTNHMDDPVMTTPAISSGMLFVRTQHMLYGIRRK
jgi:outer membrane protein assembly factor BamB